MALIDDYRRRALLGAGSERLYRFSRTYRYILRHHAGIMCRLLFWIESQQGIRCLEHSERRYICKGDPGREYLSDHKKRSSSRRYRCTGNRGRSSRRRPSAGSHLFTAQWVYPYRRTDHQQNDQWSRVRPWSDLSFQRGHARNNRSRRTRSDGSRTGRRRHRIRKSIRGFPNRKRHWNPAADTIERTRRSDQ